MPSTSATHADNASRRAAATDCRHATADATPGCDRKPFAAPGRAAAAGDHGAETRIAPGRRTAGDAATCRETATGQGPRQTRRQRLTVRELTVTPGL